MTLFYYYASGDLGNQAVRLIDGFRLSEAAEAGIVGMSQVVVDDPTGVRDLVGLKPFRVDDTACTWLRVFTGHLADRALGRDPQASHVVGTARRWDATVTDLNAVLQFRVLRGDDANRPAETDIERITWLLGSGFMVGIEDTGYIDSTGPIDMDACDYRGRYPSDLLSDCGTQSGKNYYVTWDQDADSRSLHYFVADTSSLWSSALRISNLETDVDGTTTFAPSMDAKLSRDPSRVYSGVYLQYGSGTAAVYETDSGTATDFITRDVAYMDTSIKSSTKATAKANKMLGESDSEYDRITVRIEVPAAQVNLLLPGQRLQVKFTHLPGYTSFTWIRVVRRTVVQLKQGLYALDLELANTKLLRGGAGNGSPNNEDPTDPTAPVTMCTAGAETVGAGVAASQSIFKAVVGAFSFGGTGTVESSVSPNTAFATAGCVTGCGGWGPGRITTESWYAVSMSNFDNDAIDLTVTVDGTGTTRTGVADGGTGIIGVGHGTPTGLGQFAAVGAFGLGSTATVTIPRSAFAPGEQNYVVVAPSWLASASAFYCADDLIDGCSGPRVGGEGNSGRSTQPDITGAAWREFCSGGQSSWVSPLEEVDGDTVTFTLIHWTGEGDLEVRVGALILAEGADYTVDRPNRQVTLREAPAAYASVAFRYQVDPDA